MEQNGTHYPPKSSQKLGLLARFIHGHSGVVVAEFAIVAIPFLGLLAAIFETAFVFLVQATFDNTVNNVARQVLVNSFSNNSKQSTSSFLQNTFCPALPSFIHCNEVRLNIQPYTSWSAATPGTSWYKSPPTNVNLGQPGDIVVFQAFYGMPVYFSVLVASGANLGVFSNFYSHTSNSVYVDPNNSALFVHAIFSTVAFRNEPNE
jgi:Flp pilus assembly protein TadG